MCGCISIEGQSAAQINVAHHFISYFNLHTKLHPQEYNMLVGICSDDDLPECLNTASKQAEKARHLAFLYSPIPTEWAEGPQLQGFFSRTMIVTLENDHRIVIQFRRQPLETEPFITARKVFGPVVPEINLLEDQSLEREGIWAYYMTYIPGKTWLEGATGKDPKTLITLNRSLGRILSKGCVDGSSEEVVNAKLRPHLALLLSSEDNQIGQFRSVTSDLLGKLDGLQTLPLFVSHFDLNSVNITVDDDCEVTGLIDWELSTPIPLGMGFSRIHTLAGEFSEEKFYMPPEFEDAERGFWQEVRDGVSADVGKLLNTYADALQIAVTLGTLLDAFQLEGEGIGPYNLVVIEALPKLFTYRIPFVRGSDPPYSG